MSIGYTEIDFINGSAPALNATNMNKIDEALKNACDLLDAETTAGRALVEAADADAQRTLLNVEDGADVTDATNVQAALTADASGGRSALGLGDSATLDVGTGAGDVAAGNAPADAVTTHESTYAHANLPTADEKTRLSDIQAATGANTVEKLSYLVSGSTAGYTHLTKLAAAEAASALGSYNVAFKMPQGLLGRIVQDASGDRAAVLFDDLGFPSMMFKLKGPLLAGHLHVDMGSVSGLKTVTLGVGGSSYAENEIVTITQAGGSGGKIRVLTVNSGAILTFEIVEPGTGYAVANGLASTSAGSGVDATFNITAIGPVHPAFRVNGVDKLLIYYGMYKGTSFNGTTYHGSGAGYRSVCWPGLLPTASLDFDVSKALHTAKGSGWHMTSMWERGLVNWLSMKLGTEPRGNTYYGRSHESGYEFEYASTAGTGKHYNGSGWDSWAHNGKQWGIHDLNGSLWEWQDGFKEVDGLLYMPLDNYFALDEASWPSTGVYLDNTVATAGGAPRLSNARDNALVDPNYSTVTHNALTMTAGYDGLDLAVRQRMLMAGIAPKIVSGGANPWSPKGTLYNRNYGERLPICGGYWAEVSDAGLAALNLRDPRSGVRASIGFRPAFISLS